jgi:hypothetical protein
MTELPTGYSSVKFDDDATRRSLAALRLIERSGFTRQRACKLTGGVPAYVGILARLTPRERRLVEQQKLSLSHLHNGRQGNGNGRNHDHGRDPFSRTELDQFASAELVRHAIRSSDAELDRILTLIGIGRIWSAVERLTRPST